jgi:hypothetical protein
MGDEKGQSRTSFMYGAGVQINPIENVAIDIGYEGSASMTAINHTPLTVLISLSATASDKRHPGFGRDRYRLPDNSLFQTHPGKYQPLPEFLSSGFY